MKHALLKLALLVALAAGLSAAGLVIFYAGLVDCQRTLAEQIRQLSTDNSRLRELLRREGDTRPEAPNPKE